MIFREFIYGLKKRNYLSVGDLYFDEADYRNAATRYQTAFYMAEFSRDAALKPAHCSLSRGR